jgi:hypothetical protein
VTRRASAAGSIAIAAAVIVTACGGGAAVPRDAGAPAGSQPTASAPAPVRIAHLPPTAKDIIDAAIASGGVPLSVSPTCANVGTEPSDATIGRYLAGFLAELSSPSKKNWIETKNVGGRSANGEEVSICSLILRHEDGDDRWGWGVQFQVRTSDRVVLPESFTCLGAG